MKIRTAYKITKYDDFDIHKTYNRYQIKKALDRINKHSIRQAHRNHIKRVREKMSKDPKYCDRVGYFVKILMDIYGIHKI